MIGLVTALLGVDATEAAEIVDRGTWVRLEAGDVLFEEGAAVRRRLRRRQRAARGDAGTACTSVRSAGASWSARSACCSSAPRTATVTALRDTTLCRFDVDAFQRAHRRPPRADGAARAHDARPPRPAGADTDRARSIAVAVTAPVDPRLWVTRLANEIARHGSARHLWAARVDAALGQPGIVEAGLAVTEPALAEFLHEAEATHDYLVLEADRAVTRGPARRWRWPTASSS